MGSVFVPDRKMVSTPSFPHTGGHFTLPRSSYMNTGSQEKRVTRGALHL